MVKQFFGFNNREEAEKSFGSSYLDNPKWNRSVREYSVVENARVYPQETVVSGRETTIVTDRYIISYLNQYFNW